MEGRRRSLLDSTRNNNFLRKSFCGSSTENITITREEYLAVLKKEHKEWKAAQKAAPKKFQDIVVRKTDAVDLKPQDEEFLKGRPNYLEMIENARRYIQSIAFVNKLAEDLKRSTIQRLQDIDDVIDATVSQILAERDERCSKCINNEFCTKEIHPLVENPGELIANFDNLHLSE